jgi:hypothetical protein
MRKIIVTVDELVLLLLSLGAFLFGLGVFTYALGALVVLVAFK